MMIGGGAVGVGARTFAMGTVTRSGVGVAIDALTLRAAGLLVVACAVGLLCVACTVVGFRNFSDSMGFATGAAAIMT